MFVYRRATAKLVGVLAEGCFSTCPKQLISGVADRFLGSSFFFFCFNSSRRLWLRNLLLQVRLRQVRLRFQSSERNQTFPYVIRRCFQWVRSSLLSKFRASQRFFPSDCHTKATPEGATTSTVASPTLFFLVRRQVLHVTQRCFPSTGPGSEKRTTEGIEPS